MKVFILQYFNADQHTDQQKVFLYFVSRMVRKYGYDVEFSQRLKDIRVLLTGRKTGDVGLYTVKPVEYAIKMGWLSETTMIWKMSDEFFKWKKTKKGPKGVGLQPTEITDPLAIATLLYIQGWFAGSKEWAQDGFLIEDEDNQRKDVTLPAELGQILALKKTKWSQDFTD